MSTRLYPLYQKGNPQLRVFLPNFWMKLIRPTHNQPENVVQFKCSMEMTKFDVQNYLEKIYKVPVIEVRTRVDMGKTFKEPGRGYVIKRDDSKIAYVTLVRIPCTTPIPSWLLILLSFQPKDQKFVFPDMFEKASDSKEEHEKSLKETKDNYKKFLDRTKSRPGAPGWFSF